MGSLADGGNFRALVFVAGAQGQELFASLVDGLQTGLSGQRLFYKWWAVATAGLQARVLVHCRVLHEVLVVSPCILAVRSRVNLRIGFCSVYHVPSVARVQLAHRLLTGPANHLPTNRREQFSQTPLRRVTLVSFLPIANRRQTQLGGLMSVLVLLVTPVHVLDVPRVLQVRAHLASLRRTFSWQSALGLPISVVVIIDAACDVRPLVTRRVVHLVVAWLRPALVHLADPVHIGRLHLVLGVVVLLVAALDQILLCLLHAQGAHKALPIAVDVDIRHPILGLFVFIGRVRGRLAMQI